MKEALREQIEKLHDDTMYMHLLDSMKDMDVEESYFAEMYIMQESPFAEIEPEL